MTSTTAERSMIEIVNERHAVKQFDEHFAMTKEDLKEVIELAAKAPSSWNLQHWKFLVIHDKRMKEKLLPIANNQRQVLDASATIIVLGDLEANKNAEPVFGGAVKAGMMPEEVKNTLVAQIEGAYSSMPHVARDEAIRNASFAAMQLMLVAKAKGYDTCPMGGYNARQLIEEFRIPNRYIPVLLIPIGKAARPARPSKRLPVDDVVVWNLFSE